MNHVMVIGGGGREHALAWKLAQSPHVSRISVAPGNGGTAAFAQNVDIDATDIVSLLEFAETEHVDLAVVGPEDPLAMGIVDQFEAAGVRIFGPSRQAALIETSKRYAKQLMTARNVPTGPYEVFSHVDEALNYVADHAIENIVIKADGLARGKGVFLPRGASDAEGILRALLERDWLGRAGRYVIIEERLVGEELSIMAFSDGSTVAAMPAVCDYKRRNDGDTGPNTGGMGSVAPSTDLTPALSDQICETILKPVLDGLQEMRCCFKGILNVGVVLTRSGPMALELNVRIGDPSAQTVLPLLENDLYEVIEACLDGTLDQMDIRWRKDAAVTVMLASESYPERDESGIPIHIGNPPPEAMLFHSGTRYTPAGTLVTSRGRVLAVTSLAPTLPQAVTTVYDAVRHIHFDEMHYRTDIGANPR